MDSFLGVLNNCFGVLRDLDSAISLEPKGSLDWIIDNLYVGSLGVEVRSEARDPEKDYGRQVVGGYVSGIETIYTEGVTPPYFSDNCLRLLGQAARALRRDGASVLRIADAEYGKTARIDVEIEPMVRQLRGSRYRGPGSVEGRLEMISIHRPPRFNIYHVITLRAVRCSLPDDLRGKVVGALGRRVVASGEVSYNAKDEPISVRVGELEMIPTEDELPTIEEFIGSDPEFSGDMTTGEYIRQIRYA